MYFSNLKQGFLKSLKGKNYNFKNHIKIDTKSNFVNDKSYPLVDMKILINDDKGYRLYCKVKKGNIELPHYHKGRYELFMIKGVMRYTDDRSELILETGDYYYNPPLNNHSSVCLEDSEFIWLYNKTPDIN